MGTFISFLATFHSKEVGILYFLIGIFLYSWFFGIFEEGLMNWMRKRIWLLVLFFSLLFLVYWHYSEIKGRIIATNLSQMGRYFLIQNKVFFYYLRLMFFPYFGLNVDHHILPPKHLFDFSTIISLVLNILLVYFCFHLKK
ncbi:MAG TPA: hypothetical protein DHV62_04175, partial [Elusimicrobia bacterium]|nr:hypothetical protein [Elusimicrobiota bacterium]